MDTPSSCIVSEAQAGGRFVRSRGHTVGNACTMLALQVQTLTSGCSTSRMTPSLRTDQPVISPHRQQWIDPTKVYCTEA